MKRHADAMETARLQSEGTIESLRDKLNTLQEVLVNTGDSSDDQRRSTRTRTRSSSPGKSVLDTAMILVSLTKFEKCQLSSDINSMFLKISVSKLFTNS